MKKVNRNCLPVFVAFLLVSMALLARPIDDMDEIWNYNFCYNLCNGLIPYLDFNCIVTPLSFFLSAGFLQIFGKSLFVFRILSAVLLAMTFYVLFHILLCCGKNKVLAFAGASFLLALCYLVWIFNYNSLNLLLILLALYLELRLEQEDSRKLWLHIAAGLIYGAMAVTKQSVGGLFLVYNGVLCLVNWARYREMRRFNVLRFGSSLLFPAIFVCYLLLTGSFAGFWDYAVAGVGDFTHRTTYWEFLSESVICFVLGLFPIVITVFSVYVILKKTSAVGRRFHILSLIVAWIGMFVTYPLCDYTHMSIAMVPFAVCGFCCIGKVSMKRWEQCVCVLVACVVLSAAALIEVRALDEYEICDLPNFRGLPISGYMQEHIMKVDAYILSRKLEGKDVLITNSYAAIYYLPLDLYYKDFSLLNGGNVGTQTVEQLLDRDNAVYLVFQNQAVVNNQNHFKLIDFIATQYSKIGEIAGYDIYQKE